MSVDRWRENRDRTPPDRTPRKRGLLGRIWHELTRPRGPTTHRFYRVGRSSRSGVALLVVITCFLVLMVLATEIANTASVRIKLAANLRDEVRAEYLARSGLGFYRLILVTANALDSRTQGGAMGGFGPMLQQFGVSGDMLWQMVPFINTNLLRMVFVEGGELSEEDRAAFEEQGGLTEEQREESMEGFGSKPGFLSFEGDFMAEVFDESRRINIKNIQGQDVASLQTDPAGAQLLALMTGNNTCAAIRADRQATFEDTQDNMQFFMDRGLEPMELVSNLADWVDRDNQIAFPGGNEDRLYERLEEPYRAKNAAFDSIQEIRLVEGWHRDDVWERFGDSLTVFGDGKVNVNTAECEVLWALLRSQVTPPPADAQVDSCIRAIEFYRGVVPFGSEQAFVNFLQDGQIPPSFQNMQGVTQPSVQGRCQLTPNPSMNQAITTSTKVFRVRSVGQVNDVKVTIEAVFDFSNSVEGRTLYWRID